MRDLKKIRHCNIIPSNLPKWVFLEQTEMVFDETKTVSNGNGAPDAMEQLPQATNARKIQNQKPLKKFRQHQFQILIKTESGSSEEL